MGKEKLIPASRINIKNKRAEHDFLVVDKYTAGIVLTGTEIKSIRTGKASLVDTFCYIHNGEMWVKNMYIAEYDRGSYNNHLPRRERKLLLHKREILKLLTLSQADGYSLIPLRLYLKDGKVKLELAVAKGKKLYDKRHDIAERDAKRAMDRRNADAY